MYQYALEIQKSHLPFLTMLNGGVTPEIQDETTFLVVTIEDPENSRNDIVTYEQLTKTYDIVSPSPRLMKLHPAE